MSPPGIASRAAPRRAGTRVRGVSRFDETRRTSCTSTSFASSAVTMHPMSDLVLRQLPVMKRRQRGDRRRDMIASW
jgi:hypothetical protein